MISSLHLTNFTAFLRVDLGFSAGLNVIVGENSTGKTHLLKLAYACTSVVSDPDISNEKPTKDHLQRALAKKLVAVFKPDELGRLSRRQRGRNTTTVVVGFEDQKLDTTFRFSTASREKVEIIDTPHHWSDKRPVYLPTRELLSIYPGFVSLYETTHLQFDETWRDTCLLLGAPTLRGPREQRAARLLHPLEEAMGGQIVTGDNGAFYLRTSEGSFEMHLVAEGYRKMAMLARLIATGALLDKGYLFWDEPEANMNPRLLRSLAKAILALAQEGIQVFVSTHSLFLLREFQLLQSAESFQQMPARYFGLTPTPDGVQVEQSDSPDGIGMIAALEENLDQADRYLDLA